jgi:hypothetical protein
VVVVFVKLQTPIVIRTPRRTVDHLASSIHAA